MTDVRRRPLSGTQARTDDIVRELRAAVTDAGRPASAAGLRPVDPFDVVRTYQPVLPAEPRRIFAVLKSLVPWLLGAAAVVGGLLYVSQYGLRTRTAVVREGSAAIEHMVTAKEHADKMDWRGAGEEFTKARTSFNEAGGRLDALTPSLLEMLSHVPGLGSLRAGQDIIEAGKLLSGAGASLSQVLSDVSDQQRTASGAQELPVGSLLASLDAQLQHADADVATAVRLLNSVDAGVIPEGQREQFIGMRAQLADGRGLIGRSRDAIGFFQRLLGSGQARRYLVLFQNSSELRPTGGFPGTYGVLTVRDGKVVDWRADDIYNPDGQITDLIVPPLQLQHITPGWGMRDANWFADFPTSAVKVAAFWQRGGGTAVDGVLAIDPNVLKALLIATGPIHLQEYGADITADTFLSTLQLEVEENRPSGKPKQVIADLAPLLLDKLATLPSDRWMPLIRALGDALVSRDILMYFTDNELMSYADARGWTGRVLNADGDYLMVVISNIKGAKTDAVTDTTMKLETRSEDGLVIHRLSITRQNDGNASPYGFYNKPNNAYIRVLVPEGSTLRGISGNDRPTLRPMTDYVAEHALRDADLEALEQTYRTDTRWGSVLFKESGKTGFGFWMSVKPGETGQVQIDYALPASAVGSPYRLLVQRQPGLTVGNLEVTFDKPSFDVTKSDPSMTEWPDSWRLNEPLDRDLHLEASFR